MVKQRKNVKQGNNGLLHFDGLDAWMKDNHYIKSHYRPMSQSYAKSLASVFGIHNETVNIWTHLVPGVVLGALLVVVSGAWYTHLDIASLGFPQLSYPNVPFAYESLSSRYKSATSTDALMLTIFAAGAATMFTASWFYHSVSNHSHNVSKFWNKMDYVGIIAMILSSMCPSVYYGYYCDPGRIRFYLMLLGTLGFVTFCFTILDRFRTPAWRPVRAGMFIALGLSAVFPVFEALYTHGRSQVQRNMSLTHVTIQGALYIVGAVIYAKRIPEKYYPHTFDVVGASHQIFHVCVVLAGITHAIGVLKAFDHRHGELQGYCT